MRVCDSVTDSVCVSVCPHDKTKTAENKIAKLGTRTVRHDSRYITHQWILGQRSKVKFRVIECPASSFQTGVPWGLLWLRPWKLISENISHLKLSSLSFWTVDSELEQLNLISGISLFAARLRCAVYWSPTTTRTSALLHWYRRGGDLFSSSDARRSTSIKHFKPRRWRTAAAS